MNLQKLFTIAMFAGLWTIIAFFGPRILIYMADDYCYGRFCGALVTPMAVVLLWTIGLPHMLGSTLASLVDLWKYFPGMYFPGIMLIIFFVAAIATFVLGGIITWLFKRRKS